MKQYEKPIMEVIKLDLIHTITSSPEPTPINPNPGIDETIPDDGNGGWG